MIKALATRSEMGRAAADIAAVLLERLKAKEQVRMVFAAAPSQAEMLAELCATPDIDWERITAFHMDEYIGLPADSPARFAHWLDQHLFTKLNFGTVHRIQP